MAHRCFAGDKELFGRPGALGIGKVLFKHRDICAGAVARWAGKAVPFDEGVESVAPFVGFERFGKFDGAKKGCCVGAATGGKGLAEKAVVEADIVRSKHCSF